MKKIDLGHAISICANIGVIGGILLLAVEIRQNNELMAEQQRFNRVSIAMKTNELVIENPSIAELQVKAAEDLDQLTPAEWRQLQSLEVRILRAQDWSFRELPRQELPVELWRRNTLRNSWPIVWEQVRHQFDPEFVEFMEDEVIGH